MTCGATRVARVRVCVEVGGRRESSEFIRPLGAPRGKRAAPVLLHVRTYTRGGLARHPNVEYYTEGHTAEWVQSTLSTTLAYAAHGSFAVLCQS